MIGYSVRCEWGVCTSFSNYLAGKLSTNDKILSQSKLSERTSSRCSFPGLSLTGKNSLQATQVLLSFMRVADLFM
jgi:hypothetical protein